MLSSTIGAQKSDLHEVALVRWNNAKPHNCTILGLWLEQLCKITQLHNKFSTQTQLAFLHF